MGSLNFKKCGQGILSLMLAGLLMGNKSCEQKAPVEPEGPRQLKKIIRVGMIDSQPIPLPDGSIFDFKFVVNNQIYSVLHESKAFAFRYNSPVEGIGVMRDGSHIGRLNLSKQSRDFVESETRLSADSIPFPSKVAWCMVNKPQAELGGAVVAFENAGAMGLHFGFNESGLINSPGLGVDFETKTSELEVILKAASPILHQHLASARVRTPKKDRDVKFKLIFQSFSIGPSFFFTTPLSKVTYNTLTAAVKSLKTEMSEEKQPWYSRVMFYDEGEEILGIDGGINANLQIGDQLAIYQETYLWEGEPCNSKLIREGGIADHPSAIIEIRNTAEDISTAKVIQNIDEIQPKLLIGAKVMKYKLKDPQTPGISSVADGGKK